MRGNRGVVKMYEHQENCWIMLPNTEWGFTDTCSIRPQTTAEESTFQLNSPLWIESTDSICLGSGGWAQIKRSFTEITSFVVELLTCVRSLYLLYICCTSTLYFRDKGTGHMWTCANMNTWTISCNQIHQAANLPLVKFKMFRCCRDPGPYHEAGYRLSEFSSGFSFDSASLL